MITSWNAAKRVWRPQSTWAALFWLSVSLKQRADIYLSHWDNRTPPDTLIRHTHLTHSYDIHTSHTQTTYTPVTLRQHTHPSHSDNIHTRHTQTTYTPPVTLRQHRDLSNSDNAHTHTHMYTTYTPVKLGTHNFQIQITCTHDNAWIACRRCLWFHRIS